MVEVLLGPRVTQPEMAERRSIGAGGEGLSDGRNRLGDRSGSSLGLLVFVAHPHLHEGAGDAHRRARPPHRENPRRPRGCAAAARGGRGAARGIQAEVRRGGGRGGGDRRAGAARGRGARPGRRVPASRITSPAAPSAVEQRIAQAESQAVAEVRGRAIDVAAAAAGIILAEKAKGRIGEELIERSIESVRAKIN